MDMTNLDIFLVHLCPKCNSKMGTTQLKVGKHIIHTFIYCSNSRCRYAFIRKSN